MILKYITDRGEMPSRTSDIQANLKAKGIDIKDDRLRFDMKSLVDDSVSGVQLVTSKVTKGGFSKEESV